MSPQHNITNGFVYLVYTGAGLVWKAEDLVVLGLPIVHPFPPDPLLGGRALGLFSQVLVLDHLPNLVTTLRGACIIVLKKINAFKLLFENIHFLISIFLLSRRNLTYILHTYVLNIKI